MILHNILRLRQGRIQNRLFIYLMIIRSSFFGPLILNIWSYGFYLFIRPVKVDSVYYASVEHIFQSG